MKTSRIFLSLVAVSAAFFVSCKNPSTVQSTSETSSQAVAPASGAIVYFRLDQVVNEYDMANEQRSVLEAKAAAIQQDIERRGNKLQNEMNSFQEKYQKGLMTTSVARQKGEELQRQEQEFNQFLAQKEQEMQEEQIVLMNNIMDAIQTYVEKFNAEKGYAMILASSAGQPVVVASASLDVTQDIISGLNAEYVQNKGKK